MALNVNLTSKTSRSENFGIKFCRVDVRQRKFN